MRSARARSCRCPSRRAPTRTIVPLVVLATLASCASPSALSSVVMSLPVLVLAEAHDLAVGPHLGDRLRQRGRRSARRRCASLPWRTPRAMLTGSPSRSSPSVTSTMTRTWSFDFGSCAKSSRAALERLGRRRAPTGMSFGSSCRKNCAMAPPSLVSGKLIGSPANAMAPKRAPGRSWIRRADLGLGARDAARRDVARVHALRVVEHDRRRRGSSRG